MAASFNTIDLDSLGLSPGQGERLEVEVRPEGLELGGQSYDFGDGDILARVDISRTVSGYAMRLGFQARLSGPCMRCLEAATFPISVDAREVDQPSTDDEELNSPYVTAGELGLAAWAHDAIALALPAQLVCRKDCAGLCPECGISLNGVEAGTHVHEPEPDPRWAALRELDQ
ncbi:MAG: DUF177 domain-containing protein [Actinomycetota bacterium]|nr:DUF177 domain-containing protein [Actinomycetota bacterium]